MTKTDLMRRRQKVVYAHYERVPCPDFAEVLNYEELNHIDG